MSTFYDVPRVTSLSSVEEAKSDVYIICGDALATQTIPYEGLVGREVIEHGPVELPSLSGHLHRDGAGHLDSVRFPNAGLECIQGSPSDLLSAVCDFLLAYPHGAQSITTATPAGQMIAAAILCGACQPLRSRPSSRAMLLCHSCALRYHNWSSSLIGEVRPRAREMVWELHVERSVVNRENLRSTRSWTLFSTCSPKAERTDRGSVR